MKHIQVIQNSEEWYRARLGKPTASRFDKIITATGRKTGAPWYDYMFQLIYERIIKRQSNNPAVTYWTERGRLLEPAAAKTYSRLTGYDLRMVGFITTDDGRIGCSPDRLVSNDHAVELKCPAPWQHMQYTVMGPGVDYKAQIQGQMFVAGFKRIDFFSYNPGMPCKVHEVYRDDEYLEKMDTLLKEFVDELDEMEKSARVLGDYAAVEIEINGRIEGAQ